MIEIKVTLNKKTNSVKAEFDNMVSNTEVNQNDKSSQEKSGDDLEKVFSKIEPKDTSSASSK